MTFDNSGGGSWSKYINIPITTTPSEYAQYKVVIDSNNVTVYSAEGTQKTQGNSSIASDFWNNVKSDGSDIRVFNQNREQRYFWIEEFDYNNHKAVIWVKVEAGDTELNIAYGNPNATKSSYENGEQVFEFFDDFNDLIDLTKYEYYNEGGKAYPFTVTKLFTASGGGQGLTFDGEYLYFGQNNGAGVNGSIYKLTLTGDFVDTFTGPPHCAGLDYRFDRDTILVSTGGDEPAVVWEIDKDTGEKIREWDFSSLGYGKGALVAYKGDNHAYIFTSDTSTADFQIHEVILHDDGTYDVVANWSHSSLDTPQGLDYYNGYLYYLTGGNKGNIYKLKLNDDGSIDVIGIAERVITAESEGLALAFEQGKIYIGDANKNIYELRFGTLHLETASGTDYETYIYSKGTFSDVIVHTVAKGANCYPLMVAMTDAQDWGDGLPCESYNFLGLGRFHVADDYLYGRQVRNGEERIEQAYSTTTEWDNQFNRYMLVYDTSNTTVKYYYNGGLLGSTTDGVPSVPLHVILGGGTYGQDTTCIVDVKIVYVTKLADPANFGTPTIKTPKETEVFVTNEDAYHGNYSCKFVVVANSSEGEKYIGIKQSQDLTGFNKVKFALKITELTGHCAFEVWAGNNKLTEYTSTIPNWEEKEVDVSSINGTQEVKFIARAKDYAEDRKIVAYLDKVVKSS